MTGGRGIGGAITLFRTLGGVAGGAMAHVGGWSQIIKSLSGGLTRLPALLAPLRGGLFSAFSAPLTALASLGKGIGMLILRLTGLPALWGMISGAVSLLGGALSLLLSPIGLIGAAFVAAGLLIWRNWAPIKAFFSGMFTGMMATLAPLREAFSQTFSPFSPIFDAIGTAISNVVNWFRRLLIPMESSKETLNKCASAGEAFGKVLGGSLELVLTPAKMLLDTLSWILEKLGVLPDEAEKSRKKIEEAQQLALLNDKAAFLQGFVASVTTKKSDPDNKPKPDANAKPDANIKPDKNGTEGNTKPNQPLGNDHGTGRRLQKIADNTAGLLDETKKRIGPGDIVFKNLPRALAVRGEWQESRLASLPTVKAGATPTTLAMQPNADIAAIASRPVVVAASHPVRQAVLPPVTPTHRAPSPSPSMAALPPEIHIHLHGAERQDAREIGRIVSEKLNAELARLDRMKRSSFRDTD
ncbi:hypothetical protein A0E43_04895 [Pectobacterium cacticida]